MIGILASVVMFRTDLLRAQTELHSATQTIINAGKQARQKSISVTELTDGVYPSYGLYFNMDKPREIILYANCQADNDQDGSVDEADNFGYNVQAQNTCREVIGDQSLTEPALVEKIKLKDQVKITDIDIVRRDQSINSSMNRASINFLRPEPTIWFSDQSPNEDKVVKTGYLRVEIRDLTEELDRSIFFYSTGLIEIKNH